MPCKCSKKREATSTRQTLYLKIHSTINNPTVVAHSLPHLQSRNRGTKNITKKIKACSQVAAKYLMQRKRKEKCRLHQLWWLHMCHPHMRRIKKTYCWRREQKSKQTFSLMEEDMWEPREATRTQSCMGPAELTKSLPVLRVKHAKWVCFKRRRVQTFYILQLNFRFQHCHIAFTYFHCCNLHSWKHWSKCPSSYTCNQTFTAEVG